MTTNSGTADAEHEPCLLLVEPDLRVAQALTDWFRWKVKTVVQVATAREATLQMHDASFIGVAFDGLLLNAHLPDAPGYRVMAAFRDEFPGRPIAAMAEREDLCLRLWCKARGIAVFRKPLIVEELSPWLGVVREALQPLSKQAHAAAVRLQPPVGLVRRYALGF